MYTYRTGMVLRRGAGISIIGGGGQIFIYSCSAQLISFEIDCFYSLWTRIYEYLPPQLSIFRRLWYYECFEWCLYQVVFYFIFCKDDSEMLRLSKKLSNFPMMFTEKRHSCKPPPPNEHMTFLVEKIDMWGLPLVS